MTEVETRVFTKTDGTGKTIEVTQKVQNIKYMISQAAFDRRSLPKFGESKNDKKGPNPSTTVVGEAIPFKLSYFSARDVEVVKTTAKKQISCRFCQGLHLSIHCPFKDTIKVEPKVKPSTGKYVAPGVGTSAVSQLPTLRVTNLPENMTDDDLRALFSPFGYTKRMYLAKDRTDNKRCLGFAYVTFDIKKDAMTAMERLNGRGYGNLIMKVEWAENRK